MEVGAASESVAMCCDVLAPLFLVDPGKGACDGLLEPLAGASASQLAREWPWRRDDARAEHALRLLCQGAGQGIGDAPALGRAYHHLFVGPGHLQAPPWGSVYTDRDKVRFGKSCLDLELWMRRRGVERLERKGEPQDHMGSMLALLGWIAGNRPELMEEYLAQHLLTWSQRYLDRLEAAAHAEHALYEGLAVLASELLLGLQDGLGIEVEHPRLYL